MKIMSKELHSKRQADRTVTYEQPLNARMRTLLRLEQLMQRLHAAMPGDESWQAHCALSTLIELANLVIRVDVKNDLMLELDRLGTQMQRLQNQVEVQSVRIQEMLAQQRSLSAQLLEMPGQVTHNLLRNELLGSLRKRLSIPGGACDFDLPGYHFWLSRSADVRHQLLHNWIEPFEKVLEATLLVLGIIRESGKVQSACAAKGFYQQSLETGRSNQIIRVRLPLEVGCFPEISAGKHRFTIRFLDQHDITAHPLQTHDDVDFWLLICAL